MTMAHDKEEGFSPLRRALLGALFASVVLPRMAFAKENNPASQEPTNMKIKLTFNNQSLTATLYDNPSARRATETVGQLRLLLPRTRTLDGTLHDLFTPLYPAMPANDVQPAPFAAAV
jgi:hypothetical protein